MSRERAQASIEVVALVPVLVLVVACVWQAALAGLALTAAESASRRGARAALVGGRLVVTVRVPSVVPGFAPEVSSSAPVVHQ